MSFGLGAVVGRFCSSYLGGNSFGSEIGAVTNFHAGLDRVVSGTMASNVVDTFHPTSTRSSQEKISNLATACSLIGDAKNIFNWIIQKAVENRKMDAATHKLAMAAK